jgi:hypothetical protein
METGTTERNDWRSHANMGVVVTALCICVVLTLLVAIVGGIFTGNVGAVVSLTMVWGVLWAYVFWLVLSPHKDDPFDDHIRSMSSAPDEG